MQIHDIPIGKLIAYDKNAKIHSDKQNREIANSLLRFGWKQPLVVDRNNVLIVGHGRLEGAKIASLTDSRFLTAPCIIADDLTDEEIKAYRLADNKLNESPWDFDLLSDELSDITAIDMSEFGFDMSAFEEEPTEVVEDDYEESLPEQPKAKLGDIYQLGRHRLMCGDSTDVNVIDRLMDGVKADMVFCDAPYGYKYESNHQDKYEMLKNDDKILDFIPAIWGAMKDNCPVYEFCGWQSLKQWLEYFENTSLDLKNVIIWKKNNWSMGDLKGAYAGQYEVILYLNKGRVELNGARDTDIWEFDREPPKMHPTMKPIELIAYALNKSSKKGDVVLDCFGGSGSTLIACEQLNRKCYMCELDPHYVDVIIDRWEKLTGEKAVKL